MHIPYQYVLEHPEEEITLDIKFFSLEESKKKIILSEISKYLYNKYGLIVSSKQLQSRGRYNTVSREVLEKVKEAEEYVDNFLSVVDIIDNVRNPTGIYKYVRDFALKIGTYYNKQGVPLSPEEVSNITLGIGEDYKKKAYYKKHKERHYVIILTDHYGLLETERLDGVPLSQHQTIGRYSNKYCLDFRDKFGFTPVGVQQQVSDKENIELNFKGDTVQQKLEPSLDGLANNKETQRDANIILGLFSPARYRIANHEGYNINFFDNNYRSLSLLKDRDGIADKKVPLFFNGAIDFFKELPRPEDSEGMERVTKYITQLRTN